MSGTRAFVAIELPAGVKGELSRLQTLLRQATTCPAKWVSPEGIHLTLCFLGEISPSQLEAVKGVMTEACREISSFSLETANAGAFPSLNQPQTVWIGLKGDLDILSSLYKRLEDGLRATGYKPEGCPFKPHLTLARVRDEATPADRRNLGEAIINAAVGVPSRFEVTEVSLMKSELRPSGAVYTCLHSTKLGRRKP